MLLKDILKTNLEIGSPFVVAYYDCDTENTTIFYHSWLQEEFCPDFLEYEVNYISIKEINGINCIYFEIYTNF